MLETTPISQITCLTTNVIRTVSSCLNVSRRTVGTYELLEGGIQKAKMWNCVMMLSIQEAGTVCAGGEGAQTKEKLFNYSQTK